MNKGDFGFKAFLNAILLAGIMYGVCYLYDSINEKPNVNDFTRIETTTIDGATKTSRVLEQGEYILYGYHVDRVAPKMETAFFIVSRTDGGPIASVQPPTGTKIPMELSLTCNFIIHVDEQGRWEFIERTPENNQS